MSKIRDFLADRRGATAALMSIAIVPMIGTLAIAVDYSKAVGQKNALQQVIDSAATALAKDTDSLLLTQAQLDARAMTYVKAMSGSLNVDSLTLAVATNKDTVTIQGQGNVKLAFAQILGSESLVVKAAVTVDRAKVKNFEIALALDNTGSMEGEKLTQLKLAVKYLANYMADKSKNPGTTKISLVPFGKYVKTDPAWMTPAMLASPPPNNWSGCVTDRDQPDDVSDASPTSGTVSSLFHWGITTTKWKNGAWNTTTNAVDCGAMASVTPLTSDMNTIKTAADNMVATGATNVPIGIAWAWHSLSSTQPMTGASPAGTQDLQRVMIVLTDGDNTSNRWGGNGGGAIDARMAQVCSNVKAAGILLYTIRVIDGNASALQSCATSPTHYYNVTTASQLTPVFDQIASSLSKLKISK